jgi:hypothetical protein
VYEYNKPFDTNTCNTNNDCIAIPMVNRMQEYYNYLSKNNTIKSIYLIFNNNALQLTSTWLNTEPINEEVEIEIKKCINYKYNFFDWSKDNI